MNFEHVSSFPLKNEHALLLSVHVVPSVIHTGVVDGLIGNMKLLHSVSDVAVLSEHLLAVHEPEVVAEAPQQY